MATRAMTPPRAVASRLSPDSRRFSWDSSPQAVSCRSFAAKTIVGKDKGFDVT